MRPSHTRERIIQVLQNTLVEVEASSGVNSDDPALLALKRVILRRIAYFELAEAEETPLTETSPQASAIPGTEAGPTELKVPPQVLKQEAAQETGATPAQPSPMPGATNGEPKAP